MLLDLVVQSVNEFQGDCRILCEKHYPTVHNQGMSDHHLGLAFARRMARTFSDADLPSTWSPIQIIDKPERSRHYRISSPQGTLWVLTHHFISTGKGGRESLLRDITRWQSEYGYAIQPDDLLLLVSDHWIGRARTSRALMHWWTGELPTSVTDYTRQGIALYESENTLMDALDTRFNMNACHIKFAHPLLRTADKKEVKKYLQLFAVLKW